MSEFLVKMDTPNRCCDCPMCYDYILCRLAGKEFGEIDCVEIVADWCPLVELPPHGRLIEKNAVFKLIQSMPSVDKLLPVEFMKALQEIPTVIEAEEGE